MRFWPALLESERWNVRNSTTSAILQCSVHFTIYMYLYMRVSAQLTRCFSAVAELLVTTHDEIHVQPAATPASKSWRTGHKWWDWNKISIKL